MNGFRRIRRGVGKQQIRLLAAAVVLLAAILLQSHAPAALPQSNLKLSAAQLGLGVKQSPPADNPSSAPVQTAGDNSSPSDPIVLPPVISSPPPITVTPPSPVQPVPVDPLPCSYPITDNTQSNFRECYPQPSPCNPCKPAPQTACPMTGSNIQPDYVCACGFAPEQSSDIACRIPETDSGN